MADLDKSKATSNALLLEGGHLGMFIQNSSSAVAMFDRDMRYLAVSQRWMIDYHLGARNIIGHSHYEIFPEIQEHWKSIYHHCLAGETLCKDEDRFVRADSSVQWLKWEARPWQASNGTIGGIIIYSDDITERKAAELRLRQSEKEFELLAEAMPQIVWRTDPEGLNNYFNHQWVDYTGMTLEESYGHGWNKPFHPDDKQRAWDAWKNAVENNGIYALECRLRRKDGEYLWWLIRGVPVLNESGKIQKWFGTCTDIHEIKLTEQRLAESESRYRRLIENSPDVVYVFSTKRGGIYYSPHAESLLGHPISYLYAHPFLWNESIHPDDQSAIAKILEESGGEKHFSLEYRLRDAQGNWKWVHDRSMRRIFQDDEDLIEGLVTDITALKQHEKQLEQTAYYDALTGIPNRVLLADRMKQSLAQASRNGNLVTVCYLDLDGFKPINDSMGHEVGDSVLIEVARRIKGSIRSGDTVARLGGDEFVILLMGLEGDEKCFNTLDRMLETIACPIDVGDKQFSLSASIGVTQFPEDDGNADSLLRHADQAMYSAKKAGKNRYHLYDQKSDQRNRTIMALLNQISHGLECGQFALHYQPKVSLSTRRVVGAEALIRWNHPERGLMLPGEFLYALDDTDLEVTLGEWVVVSALKQLREWQRSGLPLELSINISAFHLQSVDFVGKLRQMVTGFQELPPGSLQIEIVETAALNDMANMIRIIEECRSFGVNFALDDFGTGYSSLSYLSNLPVHTLKIDQSFVRDMLDDKGDYAIVQGVIALAKTFGHETVAEGIETSEIYQTLLKMGCETGQGYGIARPMPADELPKWLEIWRR